MKGLVLVRLGRLGGDQPGQDGPDVDTDFGGEAHGAEQVVPLPRSADLGQYISRQTGPLQHRRPTQGAVRRHQALVLPSELSEAGGLSPCHRHGLVGGALGACAGRDGDQYVPGVEDFARREQAPSPERGFGLGI
jgi:hypothetical protein